VVAAVAAAASHLAFGSNRGRPGVDDVRVALTPSSGSPNPAVAWSRSRTPVAQSDDAVPIPMIATGMRLETKRTTTAPRITKVIALSLIVARSCPRSPIGRRHRWSDGARACS
jgi:hypothetical protein